MLSRHALAQIGLAAAASLCLFVGACSSEPDAIVIQNGKEIPSEPSQMPPTVAEAMEQVKKAQGNQEQEKSKKESDATAPIDGAPSVIVATKADYQPFEFLDELGRVQGLDIDILRAVGHDQGFNVSIASTSTNREMGSFLSSVEGGGTADVLAYAFSCTPERAERFGQSDPYATSAIVAVWMNPELKIESPDDLKKLRVAVNNGYMADLVAKAGAKDIIETHSLYEGIKAVANDKADAVVGGKPAFAAYLKDKDRQTFMFEWPGEKKKLCFMARKSKPELLAQINAGLKNIKDNGVWLEIHRKWFGESFNDSPTAAD